MIARAALIALSVATAAVPPAKLSPPTLRLGTGLDCTTGYYGLTRRLVARGHYLPVPAETDSTATTFYEPNARAIWRFTLEGNRAHPAVAVVTMSEAGKIKLEGACGYGDAKAFDLFVAELRGYAQHRVDRYQDPAP